MQLSAVTPHTYRHCGGESKAKTETLQKKQSGLAHRVNALTSLFEERVAAARPNTQLPTPAANEKTRVHSTAPNCHSDSLMPKAAVSRLVHLVNQMFNVLLDVQKRVHLLVCLNACVRVCECVRVCASVCVRACVHACGYSRYELGRLRLGHNA